MSNILYITIKNPTQKMLVDINSLFLQSPSEDSFNHIEEPFVTKIGCSHKDDVDVFEESLNIYSDYRRIPYDLLKKHNAHGFFFDGGELYGFINDGDLSCSDDKSEFDKMQDFHFGDLTPVEVDPVVEYYNRLHEEEKIPVYHRQLLNSIFLIINEESNSKYIEYKFSENLNSFLISCEDINNNNSFLTVSRSITDVDSNFIPSYTITSPNQSITFDSLLDTLFEVRKNIVNLLK